MAMGLVPSLPRAVRRAAEIARSEGPLQLGRRILRRAVAPIYREVVLLARDLREPILESGPGLPFQVRLLRAEESDSLERLHPMLTASLVRQRLEAGQTGVVVWRGTRPVGVSWLKFGDVDLLGRPLQLADDEAFGWWAYTHPAFRRRGVATARVLFTLEHLRRAGYRRLLAFVEPDNRPGFGPLTKAGYRVIGTAGFVRLGPWQRHFLRPLGGRRRWGRPGEPILASRDLPG